MKKKMTILLSTVFAFTLLTLTSNSTVNASKSGTLDCNKPVNTFTAQTHGSGGW